MYYGMTTLTTVGFGDYYPITDFERSIGVIFLFGGVIIMSYTQGVFLEGIEKIQYLNAEIEEQRQLDSFFKVMTTFNNGQKVEFKL